MNEPAIIGGRGSHAVLLEVLGARPAGKVLDAPAGTGVLSVFLRDRGWEVSCADIDPGNFQTAGFPFEEVDLNRDRLPYAADSFDAVVCANGLHRLYNPSNAVREFARVLRPGGSLHITVNNYASLSKRVHFFFFGSITPSINQQHFQQTTEAPEANFRHHLFMPQLANMLESAGFRITSVRPSAIRLRHRLLAPLWLVVRFVTAFAGAKKRRENRVDVANVPAVCIGGRYLYVEAQKN